MGKRIEHGTPAIHTATGKPGTTAAEVLSAIAHQRASRDRNGALHPHRVERRAGMSMRNITPVTITFGDRQAALRVVCTSNPVPGPGTLVIASDPAGSRSMAAERGDLGEFVLRIPDRLAEKDVERMADQIVATFIVHGYGWMDRAGQVFAEPHGGTRRRRPYRAPARPRDLTGGTSACTPVAGTKNPADRYSGIAFGPRSTQRGQALNG